MNGRPSAERPSLSRNVRSRNWQPVRPSEVLRLNVGAHNQALNQLVASLPLVSASVLPRTEDRSLGRPRRELCKARDSLPHRCFVNPRRPLFLK
jgi:hypothetical protein